MKKWELAISRVLSWAIIPLGLQSLTGSSNLPAFRAGRTYRRPIWSCSGWSLPCHKLLPAARCALTAPFHPYRRIKRLGGLLSAALVVGLRRPDVIWHPALWSPDFPPLSCESSDCQASSGAHSTHYLPDKRQINEATKKGQPWLSLFASQQA